MCGSRKPCLRSQSSTMSTFRGSRGTVTGLPLIPPGSPFPGPRQSPIHRASARRSWHRPRTHHEQASERQPAASARTRCRLRQCHGMECCMASGEQLYPGSCTQPTSTWPGVARMLCLEPKPRSVRRPADLMRGRHQAEIRHFEPRTDRNRHRRTGRRLSGGRLGTGWQSAYPVVGGRSDSVCDQGTRAHRA